MLAGGITLEKSFNNLGKMPQGAASAWAAFDGEGIVGAGYKPLLYVGMQVVKGINYWFICEQTTITAEPERHIVKMAINEFNGSYYVVPHSIEVIF